VVAVALGLAASVSWGLADFIGGLKARTLDVLAVLVISQGLALLLLAVAVAASAPEAPSTAAALAAAGAGVAGVAGLAALYRGLAVGAMAVVAPIAALGAGIPVAVGIATGDRPSGLVVAGILIALGGVALAAREQAPEGGGARLAVGAGLAMAAALGIGLFLLGMDAASDDGVLWALLCARGASVAVLLAALVATRPDLGAAKPDLAAIAAIGVLDLSANGLFAVATTEGLVSVASVCSSLYPVVTILLARAVLSERVRPSQQVGVALVMLGVVAIAAG
jgi:drug/metabolite transporter (DMT)-like permease